VAEEEEEEAVVRPVVAADGKPSSKQITYILPKRIQTDRFSLLRIHFFRFYRFGGRGGGGRGGRGGR
jgi:hypothetical protein